VERTCCAWALYLLTLLSAWPLGAMVAKSMQRPPGATSGIGFGASLYGWDAAGFLLVLLGIPYAAILAIVLALLTLLPQRLQLIPVSVGLIGLAVPWTFTVFLVEARLR
jgi:hypothetical protein